MTAEILTYASIEVVSSMRSSIRAQRFPDGTHTVTIVLDSLGTITATLSPAHVQDLAAFLNGELTP